MTRDEYIGEFHALRSKPILGTHTIGVLTLTVGPRNWTLRDKGPNFFQGTVKKGPETRDRIHTALMKWLDDSNVR